MTSPREPSVGAPSERAASEPIRELHPTMDARFVLVEVGKLTANVDRLIADVKSQGEKVDALRHQATYIKGWIAAGVVLIGIFIAIASFFLSPHGDAVIQAVKTVPK